MVQYEADMQSGHWVSHVLLMGDERLAMQLLYGMLVVGKSRQGGQSHNLMVYYKKDMKLVLDSQQRRDVAAIAALKNVCGTVCPLPSPSILF